MNNNSANNYDIIIIGAGLSGICAAYHIQKNFPKKKMVVIEARSNIGGTWDLFKYPGIRSDSDMYTFGFSFHPWTSDKALADADTIMDYMHDTIKTFDLEKYIQYNSKVIASDWSSLDKKWKLDINENGETKTIYTKFVISCTGYYDYEQGHNPTFKGSENFSGKIIHPQFWDTTLDYTDKKVVVIGSGATAVTLVPEMAKKAANVTMLQRSPTYILAVPSKDPIALFFKKILPSKWAHSLSRWKNILISLMLYNLCQKYPERMKKFLKGRIEQFMGEQYNEKDFDPKYNPWDQRLCLVPSGDLFKALKKGNANIVTDTIDTFTEKGIKLNSGKELEADIIITATGLKLKMIGGIKGHIDGKLMEHSQLKAYKGVMFSDVPNMAVAIGYTNASWTLKCDLNCEFIVKVIKHMDKKGYETCTPAFDETKFEVEPLLDFDAGYVKRANDILPKQGSKKPWKVHQNYIKDLFSLKYGSVKDKYLKYE